MHRNPLPVLLVLAVSLVGTRTQAELPSFYDLRVERIEVTQATQTADSTLLLIDARGTTVRAYIDFSPGFFTALSNVDARLEIWDGTNRLYRGHATNGPATLPQTIDRERSNDTLNFDWVPDLDLFGADTRDLRFEVTVDPGDRIREFDESNNTAAITLTFACRSGPDLAYLPIDYTFDGADPSETGEPDPSLIEPGVGDAFVWGIFPFPRGIRGDRGRYRASDLEALEWDQDVNAVGGSEKLATEIGRQRLATSPTPEYLYGWLRGNPCSCNGAAWSPGRDGFGNTDTARHQRTYAHELGHSFGFGHVSRSTGEVGWDVGDRLGLGPVKRTELFDIMTGGRLTDEAWIEPARYQTIYDDPDWQCPESIPEEILELFSIPIYEILGGWEIDPMLTLFAERPPIEQLLEGRGEFRLLDGTGQVLYRQYFEPFPPGGDTEEGILTGSSVVTPRFPEAQGFEVYVDGQLVGERERSPSAPVVEILSPEPGQAIGPETEIVWTMNDEDGDELHAFVRYSPDGELRWIPLGAMTTGTSLVLRPSNLPASSVAQIEVRVTDGFQTSSAVVSGLQLGPNRLPRVHILSPPDGREYGADATLTLVGDAVDPEDGTLGETLRWFSSLDGALGEGPRLQVAELSRGTHVIDLVASDSAGGEAGDSIVVHVGTLASGPSPGEASDPALPGAAMIVTDFDPATGAISVSYDPACEATDHVVHAGPLSAVDAYDYDQTICALGTDGTATFTPTGASVFFVLVGEDGLHEGSYGTDGDGNQRPERLAGGSCGYPQALGAACN